MHDGVSMHMWRFHVLARSGVWAPDEPSASPPRSPMHVRSCRSAEAVGAHPSHIRKLRLGRGETQAAAEGRAGEEAELAARHLSVTVVKGGAAHGAPHASVEDLDEAGRVAVDIFATH